MLIFSHVRVIKMSCWLTLARLHALRPSVRELRGLSAFPKPAGAAKAAAHLAPFAYALGTRQ